MNCEIVFQPNGSIILPDLPAGLFGVLEALGQSIPTPENSPLTEAAPAWVRQRETPTSLARPDLPQVPTATLWQIHAESARAPAGEGSASRLEVKIELTRRVLADCDLCEWRCGVNRWRGQIGVCGSRRASRVARCFLNWSEERHLIPAITVDLSGCNWNCVYCQYPEHLSPQFGQRIHPSALARRIEDLRLAGGDWLHWVGGNPDQHLWTVLQTLHACPSPIRVVWNSNGWASPTTLRLLEEIADVHLVDLRHANQACAARYGAPPQSFETITRNLMLIHAREIALIVRHLQLPGHFECCTTPILHWLAHNLPNVPVNLLNGQYRPAHLSYSYPEINRRLPPEEHRLAEKLARSLALNLVEGD